MDEHKNHDIVSAAAQRTEKQHQLKETQKIFQQRIQQREKDVQLLRETVKSHKRSAQTAVEDSERIFTELIRSIERSRSELIRLIRDREKAAVSRAEGRLERLEQEINDLRRRDAELGQLSHTQDHIQFLQSFQSFSAPPESTDSNVSLINTLISFDDLRESVYQLRDKLEDFCKEELKKISDRGPSFSSSPAAGLPSYAELASSSEFTFGEKGPSFSSSPAADWLSLAELAKSSSEFAFGEKGPSFSSSPAAGLPSYAELAKSSSEFTFGEKGPSFSSSPAAGWLLFAELAKSSSEFTFGKKDDNFTWPKSGAPVFGSTVKEVSLPEVEIRSGEEDEEILFKEWAKLYCSDRTLKQWKERGVGDIMILFHPVKKRYRVLMRTEQVQKVCADHTISPRIKLMPMNTLANALMWTATDYSEGDGKIEQLAAKFKTPELAESFRRVFTDCQSRMSQANTEALSQESNPVVFFNITIDGEDAGRVVMELFAHIVPKTAENFRALCTGEMGFGYRRSVFHRIIPDFVCQGGYITNQDGTGGKSIYGAKFEDESFEVRHTRPGLLSMANRGRDANNSQFFITLKKAEHLDFKHVVFGFVKDGMDVVRRIGELGTKDGKPMKTITISECGQIN
ncbi:hypothetical protein QQF64_016963 [Cirrhinus molitorella]|uniref:peptidylprolyl isomerase n=1 Tax=Cirrhinus molitorella TaxID=172907 RepID=A0ABR3LP91_9TELE